MSTSKDAQHHSSLEKYKLKAQLDTISHPPDWIILTTLQITMPGGKKGVIEFLTHSWKYEILQSLLENCLAALIQLHVYLCCDLTILHLSIYPREMKTLVYKKTCKQMLIADLFIVEN